MAAPPVLAFRWRTSPDTPQAQWKRDSARWGNDETVGDLRRRLAPAFSSSVDLAADYDPLLFAVDPDKRFYPDLLRTPPQRVLDWTPSTCPAEFFQRHENGEPMLVLVFTFPPATPPRAPLTPVVRPGHLATTNEILAYVDPFSVLPAELKERVGDYALNAHLEDLGKKFADRVAQLDLQYKIQQEGMRAELERMKRQLEEVCVL
jgi:hypothetical protein